MRYFLCILIIFLQTGCESSRKRIEGNMFDNKSSSFLRKDADKLENIFFKPAEDDGFWCRYYNRDDC
jgi:hypothetical protein